MQRYMGTNVFQLSSVARESTVNRKLVLPVDSRMLLYSRYKHVHGTPTTGDFSGLPLSRLQAIDNLIDRLIALRGRNTYWVNTGEMNLEDLNFTMERLRKELNRGLAGNRFPLTSGSAQNDLGLTLNLVA
ncbi:MAG: hypothetical protein JW852_04380 [Spirochaetales bacterium]|nr:hypothetical protein [Spirochaetales bacterium]